MGHAGSPGPASGFTKNVPGRIPGDFLNEMDKGVSAAGRAWYVRGLNLVTCGTVARANHSEDAPWARQLA
jgi:hypothetical protein